jgi:guanylate kinase
MLDHPDPRIVLVAICGPTCAGKTTLSNALRRADPRLTPVVTTTTRQPRPGEVDGRDYNFVTDDAFRAKLADGALLEHDRVFANFYGIETGELARIVSSGRTGVAVITPAGLEPARSLCRSLGTDLLTVFVGASPETLVLRLLQRFSAEREDRASHYATRLVQMLDTLPTWHPDRYDVAEPNFGPETASDLVRRIQDALRRPTVRAAPLRSERACALQRL